MSDSEILLDGLSTVFDALGRGLLCLGPDFRVVHASESVNRIGGDGAAQALIGKPVEEVLGPELFGPQGILRRALQAGERREDWSGSLDAGLGLPHRVSLSVAPILHPPSGVCDPRVAYVAVLRPSEEVDADSGETTQLLKTPLPSPAPAPPADLTGTASTAEVEQLRATLESHRWRREATAQALGVSRTTLWRRMRELGLAN